MTDTTTDDRALLNQLAEQARHWQDIEDLREQQNQLRTRSSTMHDPIALAAELKRKDQILRDTEDQLAEARRQIAELTSRVEALQIHTAIVRIPAQPPDPDGGLCEPILYEKPIRDVPTGGVL